MTLFTTFQTYNFSFWLHLITCYQTSIFFMTRILALWTYQWFLSTVCSPMTRLIASKTQMHWARFMYWVISSTTELTLLLYSFIRTVSSNMTHFLAVIASNAFTKCVIRKVSSFNIFQFGRFTQCFFFFDLLCSIFWTYKYSFPCDNVGISFIIQSIDI